MFWIVSISSAFEEGEDTCEFIAKDKYPPNTESEASDVWQKYFLYSIVQVVMMHWSWKVINGLESMILNPLDQLILYSETSH